MPPNIGAAIRWVTSEPVEVLSMIGINPTIVEIAVIATGRTRFDVADRTASLISATDKGSVVAYLEH